MNITAQQTIQKTVEQATEKRTEGAEPSKTAEAGDVSRFQDAMQEKAGTQDAQSVEQIQTASQAGQTGQAAPKTVGDKILEGMRSYGADFSDNMSKAEVSLKEPSKEHATMDELMSMTTKAMETQEKVTTLSLETQVATNSSQKGNQGVQTLLKGQ